MELDEQEIRNDPQQQPGQTVPQADEPVEPSGQGRRRRPLRIILDVVVVVLFLTVGYFSYTYVARSAVAPVVEKAPPKTAPRTIQLDVLNGCGAKGVASRFTSFLRTAGFDVVEMKNYKVSAVPSTLVVDRIGDLAAARRVASALGVAEKNVIQQINSDYFVNVSVIIGGDYNSLHPSR
jgi:hypothetical protein